MALVSTFNPSPVEDQSPNVVTLLEQMQGYVRELRDVRDTVGELQLSNITEVVAVLWRQSCLLLSSKQYPNTFALQLTSTSSTKASTSFVPMT